MALAAASGPTLNPVRDRMIAGGPNIVVVGLGYVGLPLAVALARHFPTTGLDIDGGRIAELKSGHDRTREIEPDMLERARLPDSIRHKGETIQAPKMWRSPRAI